MNPMRVFSCCVGLVIALAPLAAFADQTSDHSQAELANAAAQLGLAQQQATDIQAQTQLNMDNDHMIALLQSEAFRQHQLDVSSNGNAIEQIGHALANAARQDGDLNARNELIIAQGRAAILVSKADDTLANAMAQGRPSEIANAKAQSNLLHQLADMISGTLAEQNMSNAKQQGEMRADMLHSHGIVEAANGSAMGANDLLAGDLSLAAGTVNAFNSQSQGTSKASAILDHAAASLRNAQAMAAAH